MDGLRVTVGEGITGWVAVTGQPLNVPDADADPRAVDVPGSLDLLEESMLLAPAPLGRSDHRRRRALPARAWPASPMTSCACSCVLADLAAVAIENARLLAERDRHVSELEALLDISQAGGGARRRATSWRACWRTGCATRRTWTPASSRAGTSRAVTSCPSAPAGRSLADRPRDLAVDRAGAPRPHHRRAAAGWMLDPATRDRRRAGTPGRAGRRVRAAGAALDRRPRGRPGRARSRQLATATSTPARSPGCARWPTRPPARWRTPASCASCATPPRRIRSPASTATATCRTASARRPHEPARSGSPLSVLMIDLDDFKRVNDDLRPPGRRPGPARHRRHAARRGAHQRRRGSLRRRRVRRPHAGHRRDGGGQRRRSVPARPLPRQVHPMTDGTERARLLQRGPGALPARRQHWPRGCCAAPTPPCTRTSGRDRRPPVDQRRPDDRPRSGNPRASPWASPSSGHRASTDGLPMADPTSGDA